MDLNKIQVSANEIVPGIWLGNEASSQSIEFLRTNNIVAVVNCTKHIPFLLPQLNNLRIPVNDPGPNKDITHEDMSTMLDYVPLFIEFIDYYQKRGENILIHCHAGMQRSAAVCAIYLSKGKKENLLRVIQLIIARRPIAFNYGHNINFRSVLMRY